jgi:hypothetical protein
MNNSEYFYGTEILSAAITEIYGCIYIEGARMRSGLRFSLFGYLVGEG